MEPGPGGEGGGNPPTPSVSLGRVNFRGINGSSSYSSDDSCTSNDTSHSNDSGDLSAVVGDLRGAWRFSASSTHCKADARDLICGA